MTLRTLPPARCSDTLDHDPSIVGGRGLPHHLDVEAAASAIASHERDALRTARPSSYAVAEHERDASRIAGSLVLGAPNRDVDDVFAPLPLAAFLSKDLKWCAGRPSTIVGARGWCFDDGELVPGDVYLTGDLWAKYDRAHSAAQKGDKQAAAQAKRLLEAIKPAVYEDIRDVSPRQGWVPLELLEGWMALLQHGAPVRLVRKDGLVQPADTAYDNLKREGLGTDVVLAIGWINHDKTYFRPKARQNEDIDVVRLRLAREWEQSFRAWVGASEDRKTAIEHAYQRAFQGFRAPEFSSEPLTLTRWNRAVPLKAHQNAGARRLLANRGGLLAFDVGVGKTYTGRAAIVGARQEGWCKRPIVLVPNSIIWKWEADFRRVLPDYRVGVIGSKRKVISSGPRKGHATSDTDTARERAAKWTRFQAGDYDVVLLTYSALPRTRLNLKAVEEYADKSAAIEREIALRRRNASKKTKGKRELTEREQAVLREGIAAWVAEQTELPEGWEADTGIVWEDIGCDLLVVDEAQNFKNLYLPEEREGGVPRFMGNAGEGSKRAWNLDFRGASVRRKTGGAGVILLSATPAKNSPLELYNLIQMVDHEAFERMGIRDPEQFIDRFCEIEIRDVVDAKMDVVSRSACVGFKNLDGHIVFLDNVAGHVWVRMVLEEAGIAPDRIAILNAEVAEAAADRQRIAMEFNGNPDEGLEPKYDVVIANAVAYEGVDLQKRTCAIHHLDLPWEPATLQQRNGRGVRQGNTLAAIQINYYFARRSQDGLRFNLIQGKRGWMAALLEGQARDTNNPGAQMELGPEEILLFIARDPEKVRERLNEVRARREAEARRKIASEASATLRAAADRFVRASRTRDPELGARLRSEAEQGLEDLARVDPAAWPWAAWAFAGRGRAMLVPPAGESPVFEGLRVARPDPVDPSVTDYLEFGKVLGDRIGLRRAGSATWTPATWIDVVGLKLRPEHKTDAWPADDEERMEAAFMERLAPRLAKDPKGVWEELGWSRATDTFVDRAWARLGGAVLDALTRAVWRAEELHIPVMSHGLLQVGLRGSFTRVIPPTAAGWAELLTLAPSSGLKFAVVEEAAVFWFGRYLPRNSMVAAAETNVEPAAAADARAT